MVVKASATVGEGVTQRSRKREQSRRRMHGHIFVETVVGEVQPAEQLTEASCRQGQKPW